MRIANPHIANCPAAEMTRQSVNLTASTAGYPYVCSVRDRGNRQFRTERHRLITTGQISDAA